MSTRPFKAALVALLGVLALGLPLAVAPAVPAGADPLPLSLEMPEGGGTLVLRDSEEPAALETPTTFTGSVDDATGVISGGSFSTAPLSFEFEITEPLPATVYVDAVFTELAPASVTGSVTPIDGTRANVAAAVDVGVDLHIEVERPAILESDCTASPVSLRFTSSAPYDQATGSVTLTDSDFSVPPVPVTPECNATIANGVNERLAGGGHSIEILMEGDVPFPTVGAEETATTLSVSPESSRQGREVTMTAQVAPAPGAAAGVPTGSVEFSDGSTVLDSVALDDAGTATYTTTSLGVGPHQLSARYQGDETYNRSTSPVVEHLVAAAPTLTLPESLSPVVIGGLPRSVPLTIANPVGGGAIPDARIDLRIARTTASYLDPTRITVEQLVGDTWQPVVLTSAGFSGVTGTIGPFALPAESTTDIRLRITAPEAPGTPSTTQCSFANPTCPGPVSITATLNAVAPETGAVIETLAEDQVGFDLIEASRAPTTMVFAGGAPRPHTVRQGFTFQAITTLSPNRQNVPWGGLAETYIDGVQVPVLDFSLPTEANEVDQYRVRGNAINPAILLPADIEPGLHRVTVRYLGDAFHGPAEASSTFTVLPAAGHPFVCVEPGGLGFDEEWGTNVVFDADLPASTTSGGAVDLDVTDARMLMNRTTFALALYQILDGTTAVPGDGRLDGVSFGLGPDGSGTAASVTRTGGTALPASPNPADESQVDQTFAFGGVEAAVTVTGAPGDIVPVTLDQFEISTVVAGFPVTAMCTAVGEPMEVGEVEIAGTTVSVDPEGPVREAIDDVTISAETFPGDAAGSVTFTSDIDGALGTEAVADGTASLVTDELSPGTHQITASFDATDPAVPDSASTAVTVVVIPAPATATEAFVTAALIDFTGTASEADIAAGADAIDGGQPRYVYLRTLSRSDEYLTHVVNELYVNTLGREGDPEGIEFWVGRLRDGLPVASVAARFYSSDEYYAATGGTPEGWVGDLYETLLGRAGEPDGVDFWVGEISRIGRTRVALRFYQTKESGEFRVADLYDFFLDREPSQTDLDFWTPRVRTSGDLVLAVSLATSNEYYERAGDRFPVA